jgi:hypothetical protein
MYNSHGFVSVRNSCSRNGQMYQVSLTGEIRIIRGLHISEVKAETGIED